MKEITLSNSSDVTLVDDDVFSLESVQRYTWRKDTDGYPIAGTTRRKDGKATYLRFYLHHFILPKKAGFVIDHINRDILDNRRSNLRYATYSQNNANKVSKKGEGYQKGVYWNSAHDRWVAKFRFEGINYHVGEYKDKEEAIREYEKKCKEIQGEFALAVPRVKEPKKVIEELEYRIWNEVVLNGLKEDVKHAASDWDMHNKINEIIRFLTHLK